MHIQRKYTGFTIVEVLIVIVVIAILAAISVVAYNGIQRRAINGQIISAARMYKQAFEIYLAQNGDFPSGQWGVGANYCLGHGISTCTGVAAQAHWQRDEVLLEPALRTVLGGNLPSPSFPPSTYSTNDPNMGYLPNKGGTTSPTLDGKSSAFLIYILDGDTDCAVGPAAGGSWPNFTTVNSNSYTYRSNSVTVCWVPLPR